MADGPKVTPIYRKLLAVHKANPGLIDPARGWNIHVEDDVWTLDVGDTTCCIIGGLLLGKPGDAGQVIENGYTWAAAPLLGCTDHQVTLIVGGFDRCFSDRYQGHVTHYFFTGRGEYYQAGYDIAVTIYLERDAARQSANG